MVIVESSAWRVASAIVASAPRGSVSDQTAVAAGLISVNVECQYHSGMLDQMRVLLPGSGSSSASEEPADNGELYGRNPVRMCRSICSCGHCGFSDTGSKSA